MSCSRPLCIFAAVCLATLCLPVAAQTNWILSRPDRGGAARAYISATTNAISRLPGELRTNIVSAWEFHRATTDAIYTDYSATKTDLHQSYGATSQPTFVAADGGGCVQFDGVNDFIFTNAIRNDAAGTVAVWVKFRSLGTSQFLWSSGDEVGINYLIGLAASTGSKARFYAYSAATLSDLTGGTTLVTNQWYFLMLTSGGGTTKIYVDTVPETLSVVAGANNGAWLDDVANRDNTVLGCYRRSSNGGFFDGWMSAVYRMDRVATATEGTNLWNYTCRPYGKARL